MYYHRGTSTLPEVGKNNGTHMVTPTLALKHVRKYFGAVHALEDASLELFAGEIHALVGENGAGKSTLVKILAGLHQKDAGEMLFENFETTFTSPKDSIDSGIAVIYQEPTLFPDLTIAENIYMERQPRRSFNRIDYEEMNSSVSSIFASLGVALDPRQVSIGLSIAEQQLVEIAKALTLNAKVVVMDEPTAALSAKEVERLFHIAKTLKAQGVAILFISHRLEEVFRLCDRVTVMRDGRFVMSDLTENVSEETLVRAMVGRDVDLSERSEQRSVHEVVLEVERLSEEGVFNDISFSVRAGEVVALSGLVGSGRSEVVGAIFGIRRYDYGSVKVNSTQLKKGSPARAMEAGIALVPEDRRQQGLVMEMAISRNIALASLASLKRFGVLSSKAEKNFSKDWALKLRLKYSKLTSPVSTLSGGNQQKVVLAKWLSRSPKVLIVDEPTRGIDIGTKVEVHRLIFELARTGVAVLVVSSELPEVLALSDRILVMREGSLVGEFERSQATEEKIIALATTTKAVA